MKLVTNTILDDRQVENLTDAMRFGLDAATSFLRIELEGTGKFVYRGGHHVCVTPRSGNPRHLVCVIDD